MRMPALAVVGADHQIVRSTETFRSRCDDAAALCDRAPELDLVLTGKTDAAVIAVGDLRVAVEAVTDAAGARQAILSLPGDDLGADPDAAIVAVREAAGESSALVWVKDLDGQYLYVNGRFERYLDTSAERLCGFRDADLPAVETVDGPRLRYIEDGLEEPLQLEYSVPAYESRPPMAVFRFPLRNGRGKAIATCGVAAPNSESQLASDEAVRLMQLERWNRIDPHDVRAELLEQWRVQATPGPAPPGEADEESPSDLPDYAEPLPEPTPPPDATETVESPLAVEPPAPEPAARAIDDVRYRREDEWVRQLRQSARISADDAISETADALQSDLQLARTWAERAGQLQGELQEAHARIRDAEAEAQQAVAAAEAARSELEQGRAELEAARTEVEAARREVVAARAQSESLRGPADAASRLSEELGRALAVERERGDELGRALARIRSRLGDLETALDRGRASAD